MFLHVDLNIITLYISTQSAYYFNVMNKTVTYFDASKEEEVPMTQYAISH